MSLSSALKGHGITQRQFDRFLAYLGGSVVDMQERHEERVLIVTVEHGGEVHGYGAHDIRMIAARC